MGPKPPAEDGAHRYVFQLIALDRPLDLPPSATRAEVLTAMQGRVLAAGRLTGTYDHQP